MKDEQTPSPDVMELAEEVVRTWPLPLKGAKEAAANVIVEAKARWEREALERAAQVADTYCSIHVEKRDDALADGNCAGALTKARQAQTCDELAAAIRALKEPRT